MHVIELTFHSIVHRDIQEVCRSSRILTALVLKFAGARWGALGRSCFIHFLPDAKHSSGVEKSTFADIVGKAAWSCT